MSKRLQLVIFTILLTLCFSHLNASQVIDSLNIEIKNAIGTEKYQLYSALARELAAEAPHKALALCDSLLENIPKDSEYRAHIMISKGEAFYYLQDYVTSLNYYDSILKNFSEKFTKKELAFINYCKGLNYNELFNHEDAIRSYRKSMELYMIFDNFKMIAILEASIGISYEEANVWDKALEHYVQSYIYYDRLGDQRGIANTYNNMGNIYQSLMNMEKALEFYQKAKLIFAKEQDKAGLSVTYNNIGIIHDELKEFDTALEFYEKSKVIDIELKNSGGLATALNNIGVMNQKIGHYYEAERNYLRSLEISDSLKDKWSVANTKNNLSELYTSLKNFTKAEEYLKEALLTADRYQLIDLIIDGYLKYSIFYMAKNDYKHAYEYYKKSSTIRDSLYSNFSMKIAEIQNVFETEEKNRELELLRLKDKHSSFIKIFFIVASIILLILACWLFYLFLMKKKEVKVRKKIEREQLRLTSIVSQAKESILMTDLKGDIVYANKFFENLTGYDMDEVIGKNPNLLQSGLTKQVVYQELWETLSNNKVWNGTFINKRKDSSLYYESATIFPIKDKTGKVINLASVKRDITENVKSSENLKESEKRFRSMADNINDGLTIIEDSKVVYTNKRLSVITGYSNEELTQIDDLGLAASFEIDRISALRNETGKDNGNSESFEYWIERKDGKLRYVRNDYSFGDDDQRKNKYIITSDITDKKNAEERLLTNLHEKEIMLKEIHHRVKNNMQVISSLLKLQSGYVKNKEALELFKNSQNRVKTMALVHEKLYRSKNLSDIDIGDYIKNLVQHIMATYLVSTKIIKINYDISDVYLDLNSAVPCGLILNELISNACKYAFSDGREGIINVSFKVIEDSKYLFTVSDNGIGLPKNFKLEDSTTLGMQLVYSLTLQLHGKIEVDNNNGASFAICFEHKKKPKNDVLYPKSLRKIITE